MGTCTPAIGTADKSGSEFSSVDEKKRKDKILEERLTLAR